MTAASSRPRRRRRIETIADEKGRWIDALARAAARCLVGRQAGARATIRGAVKSFTAPTTVRGLAFMPKGYRLAVTHYNGASLWFPNAAAEPSPLEWKGSHLDVAPLAGRALSRHLDAGERAAWLADRRLAQHAHDRLSGQDALARLVA